jgi:hypothetical protein
MGQRQLYFGALHHMGGTGATLSNGSAYFTYIGAVTTSGLSVGHVWAKLHLGSVGSGITQSEFGLFSTATQPGGLGGQVLTKLASGSAGSMTGAEILATTTSAMTYMVPPGTYLWAGVRCLGTTMPKISGLDTEGMGVNLVTPAAPLFSSATTFVGTIPAVNAGVPGLYISPY